MTPNVKLVKELTDEELEKRIQEFNYDLSNELLVRFKTVKAELTVTKVQLERAVKEAVISDKAIDDYKRLNREIIDDYVNQLERLVEAESRLAYYEGDDE